MGANIEGQSPIQKVYDTVSNGAAETQEYTEEQFVEDFTSAFDEVKAQEAQEGTASGSGVSTSRLHGSFLGKVEASTGQAIDPNSDQGKAILNYMHAMANHGSSLYDEDYFDSTEFKLAIDGMGDSDQPSQTTTKQDVQTSQNGDAQGKLQLSPEEADFESRGGAKKFFRENISNDGLTATYTLADGTKAVYTREKGSSDWKFDPARYQPAQAQAEAGKVDDKNLDGVLPKAAEDEDKFWETQGGTAKDEAVDKEDDTYTPPPKAADDEDKFWEAQGGTAKDEAVDKEDDTYTPPPKAAENEDKDEAATKEEAAAKVDNFNEKIQNAAKKENLDLSYDFSYGDGFVQTHDEALESLSNTIALHYNIPSNDKEKITEQCAKILSDNGRQYSGDPLKAILHIANNGYGGSDDYLKW